jgi:hypothetical protein
MRHSSVRTWKRLAASAVLATGLWACRTQDQVTAPVPEAPFSAIRLELSSPTAKPGDRVAVRLHVNRQGRSGDPMIGLQGRLRFDVNALEFAGQELGSTYAIANDLTAPRGAVTFAVLDPAGLDGAMATFAFVVRRGGYSDAIRFEPHGAVARSMQEVSIEGPLAATPAAFAVPVEPTRLSVQDWVEHLWPDAKDGIMTIPGQHVAGLMYGDVNLNGVVNLAVDAALAANMGVGNQPIIVGTDASNRDGVIAANVFPFNLPGNGEPGDAVPPGRNANGSFTTDIFDAAAIANEFVGNPQPIVGDVIPGRENPLPTCTNVNVPAGSITSNTTWTNNNCYTLQGIVRVNGGAVLTIQAGTVVQGSRTANPSALFIEREGMIDAQGTRAQPIVFTCDGTDATKFKGCWGGLWVAGWASINESNGTTAPAFGTRNPAGGQAQNQGEGNGPLYGGGNDNDNSGTLRYAIIEYGGFLLSANNELNGLTLGGVGRGTTLEYLNIRNGLDDGVEFFGGTVNMRFLVIDGNSDDAFDATQGWNGSAQFVIIQHNPADADKGIEWDNAQAGGTAGNNLLPRTTGTMYNFTFIGQPSPHTDPATGDGGNASNDAWHIRKGSRPMIRNSIIAGWGRIFRLDDAETCASDASGTLTLENNIIVDYGFLENSNAVPAGCSSESTILSAAGANNTIQQGTLATAVLLSPFHAVIPDFRLAGSLGSSGAVAPPAGNTFIVSTSYLGAVNPLPGGDAWFSGWTRGFSQTSF